MNRHLRLPAFILLLMLTMVALVACEDETTTSPGGDATDPVPVDAPTQQGGTSAEGNQRGDATAGPTPTPTPLPEFPDEAVDGDYDYDDDGLIEIRTLAQLDAMRLDPEGTGFVQEGRDQYFAAFTGTGGSSPCPQVCTGYELAADLDFDTNGNGEADAGDEYWNDGMGWEPLPGIHEGISFDGNGYTISNLFISIATFNSTPTPDYGDSLGFGLFSANHGEIRNVNLASASVQYTASGVGTGNLVGYNYGTVSNCSASGRVVAGLAGGLVGVNGGLLGVNESSVVASVSSASVSGIGINSEVGGLVGRNTHEGSIEGSEATGPVSDGIPYFGHVLTGTAAGGLVGSNHGSILDSTASGDVTGTDQAGGLVGRYDSGSISGSISGSTASGNVSGGRFVGGLVGGSRGSIANSKATGAVSSTGPVSGRRGVGGLVGGMLVTAGVDRGTQIENSVSEGEVHGSTSVGGLVGWASPYGRIINSSSSGDVYGGKSVGGLVGANLSSINDSRASGSVNGVFNVGGLVGTNGYDSFRRISASISGSSSEGRVTGGENVGGLVGFNSSEASILNSHAEGDVAGITYRGDLVGADDGGTIENSEGTGAVELNDDEDLLNEWGILSSLPENYHPEEDGIILDHNGRVIHMSPLKTAGIPPELSSLTNLQSLVLGDLRGEIPPELGNLTNLEHLYISSNDVTGEIPRELGNLANLQYLQISGYGLSGEIPAELGNLTNLTHLSLTVDLTGEIPPELGNLTNLTYLYLSGLTGEMPPELGNLTNLTYLYLSGLTGEMPPELGNLTNLTYLYLSGLTGEIPPELGNLTNLSFLRLGGDGLTGCIPANLESPLVNAAFAKGVTYCTQ